MFRKAATLLLLFLVSHSLLAQSIKVNGYFLEDSIKIGISTPYVLTSRHPENIDIIFPDSLYNFAPYELGEKLFAPTITTGGISYDSAIYYIISFEIDSAQLFQLPVYQITSNDSIAINPPVDTIFLQHMVEEMPDSVAIENLPLIENTNYRYIDLAFNYPWLIGGIISLIILTVAVYLLFGNKIKKYFKLRKLNKNYIQFTQRFIPFTEKILSERELEQSLIVWKNYLEGLLGQPISKMTTRELIKNKPMASLSNTLSTIDKIIYGKKMVDQMPKVDELRQFAEKEYEAKVNELKNG